MKKNFILECAIITYREGIITTDDLFIGCDSRQLGIVADHGKGSYLWDSNGKKYLDFVSGIAALSLGHCHPVVVKAIQKQSKKLLLSSNYTYTEPQNELAKYLYKLFPEYQKHYFQNSGAEAVELAIKLARYWAYKNKPGAYKIISLKNSFHGRTLGALSATGKPQYQEPFAPLVPGFFQIERDDIGWLHIVTDNSANDVAAILLESIQGEGGVYPLSQDFANEITKVCKEKNILLILDEIQTGIGRTGKWFGFEHFGLNPDIICIGKGFGGGVPISGVLAKDFLDLPKGLHGTTFGGNPLCCAVALEVLKYIEENNLVENVRRAGIYLDCLLFVLLTPFGITRRGLGLMWVVDFGNKEKADKVFENCRKNGLLIGKVTDTAIRLLPPLNVTKNQIDEAIDILDRSI